MPTPLPLPDSWLPDPFTAAYRATRTHLLAHAGFDELVNPVANGGVAGRSSPIGRFPDMSDPKYSRPPSELDSTHTPEVLLVQSGFTMNRAGPNSMTSELVQTIDLIATFDNLRVTPVNELKTHAFIALCCAPTDYGLPGLVRDWVMRDGTDDAFGQREWKRGSLRYLSMVRIVIQMTVPRSLIRACFRATITRPTP